MRLSTYTDTEQLDKSSLLNSSKMGGGALLSFYKD